MKTFALVFLAAATLLAASCSVQLSPPSGAGIRASLGGPSTSSARSLLHLAQWQLTGSGPNGESFDTGALDFSQTVTKTDLSPGEWTLEAKGLNADGKAVSSAQSTVTLLAGETTDVPLTLSFAPLTGDTTWKFVDGGTAKGLSNGSSAYFPSAATLSGKLYVAWSERTPESGSINILRVSAYNGNDDAPAWTSIDSGSTMGMNHEVANTYFSHLYTFNDALYVAWVEQTTPYKGHVSKYNGDGTWTALTPGAGISYFTGAGPDGGLTQYGPRLASVGNKLYAVWENSANGRLWLHASEYVDGTTWNPLFTSATELGIPVNDRPAAIGFDGHLVVGWVENSGPVYTLRVSSYDGTAWSTTSSIISSADPYGPNLAVADGKLYLSWNDSGLGVVVRASFFGGDFSSPTWTSIDGGDEVGLNFDPTQTAWESHLVAVNGALVLLWTEEDSAEFVPQLHVKAFNGDVASPVWTAIDGNQSNGLNRDPVYASVEAAGANLDGKLYLVSAEEVGYITSAIHVLRGK